ncbi:unnamed protein product, partial [Symbiodinium sp. CCMP2456]
GKPSGCGSSPMPAPPTASSCAECASEASSSTLVGRAPAPSRSRGCRIRWLRQVEALLGCRHSSSTAPGTEEEL